jgi:hypothetical protein
MVPFPLPLPEVIVIQPAVVEAVQPQPAVAKTEIVALPPPARNTFDSGEIEYEQLLDELSCVIETVCPATVSVPALAFPVELTATE